ncbi:MAG: 3,4-dihydroxy-2-butanone-4-phosphate synthase [Myxococcota bacterium]|nr:3,4-dihydroxy-2-butanone-4-phosphate synthase [Myxococcota bacterium]
MKFEVMAPDPKRRVELALEDIRAGKMVILVDDEDRENEGDLTMAADAVTPEAINFMATYGRGLICLTLTEDRVQQLQLPMMVANNQSPYHTAFTVSIEAREGVSTGISAKDRAHTIRVAIEPTTGPYDIVTPGHIFPLRARDGGVLVRTGQTEGSVDLARLAGLTPAGVICEIMNEDGSMARLPDLIRFGERHNIRILAVADLIRWRLQTEKQVENIVQTKVHIKPWGEFDLFLFRSKTDKSLHLSLTKGEFNSDEPVLVRVQASKSAIDVFGFSSSDSREQLGLSLEAIAREGRGALLYLNVSGSSNEDILSSLLRHLNLDENSGVQNAKGDGSLRELGTGAQMLLMLGIRKMRLMTNNPRKIVGLEGFGLEIVERVPLTVSVSDDNKEFLRKKILDFGHFLSIED